MKKALLCLVLFLSACGTVSQPRNGDTESLTHTFEKNGLSLKAEIHIGKKIKVDAAITNISGENIIYNGRCGVPFGINVKKGDADSYLVSDNDSNNAACDDMFDPADLRELDPDETLKKEVAFKRKVKVSDNQTAEAFSGKYEVTFSFELHERESFETSIPIKLSNAEKPDILTMEQARETAKVNSEVKEWFAHYEQEGITVKPEEAMLSSGMWTVAFYAVEQSEAVKRIVINLDAESGKLKGIHQQNLGKGPDAKYFLKEQEE
ncbi:hypothetical protein ACOJQI_11895 [Bacillus salacetis]|uniref:hypothetical protein n=1 Tax=Bacillus salacetis TaxID=2315464 RepID=UPI003BA19105